MTLWLEGFRATPSRRARLSRSGGESHRTHSEVAPLFGNNP
jgi:hypothetical protein